MRKRWLAVGALAAFGCQTMVAPDPHIAAGLPVVPSEQDPGRRVNPPLFDEAPADHLALAAECTGRGDQPAAASHLERYVCANPDQLMFRAHLAELLFKIDQPERAKFHFETFIAEAQTATGPPNAHMVHCHTRLMEIGGRGDDRYTEMLHRGVGLLILVKDAEADDEFREEMLCKAIKALLEAKECKPTDARVQVYLADAHALAGNRRAADAARGAARSFATPGTLTVAESRRVSLR